MGVDSIEIYLEERQTYYLTKDTESLKPYIVGNYLVFLISLAPDKDFPNKPQEEIRTFLISNSYDMIEEKVYQQKPGIILNFRTSEPVTTYLPEDQSENRRNTEKLAFVAMILIKVPNDIPDFYFEEATKTKSVVAFFDPSMPSLNCFNIVELPNNFVIASMGPLVDILPNGVHRTGLAITGNKFSVQRVFHLLSHNFDMGFYFFRNQESVFDSKMITNKQFSFNLINYQHNDEKDKINTRVELKMDLGAKQGISFLKPLNNPDDEELSYAIDQNRHKIIYLASPEDNNLRIQGGFYDIQFEYESTLENLMGRIDARYRNEYEVIPKDKIFGAKQSL